MNLVSFTVINGEHIEINPDHVVYIRQLDDFETETTRIVVMAKENSTGGIQPGYFDVHGLVPEIRQKLMEPTIPAL